MIENSPDPDRQEVKEAIRHLHEAQRDLAEGKGGAAEHEIKDALKELEQHHRVIVNGRPKEVEGDKLTYDQVVKLAFDPPPSGPDVQITVQYTHGPEHKPTGTLVEGQSVKIRNGMMFDVTATNRS